jgi:HEAT repeats/HEAT repeat
MAEAPIPVETKPRSRRLYTLWSIALTLLFSAGLFCWLVVLPVSRAESILLDVSRNAISAEDAVTRMGGPKASLRKMRLYLACPRSLVSERVMAVHLLGLCGAEAIPILHRTLKDPDPKVRSWSASSLVTIGPDDGRTLQILSPLLADDDHLVRANTAAALADLGAVAVPVLKKALQDKHPLVRKIASRCLAEIEKERRAETR